MIMDDSSDLGMAFGSAGDTTVLIGRTRRCVRHLGWARTPLPAVVPPTCRPPQNGTRSGQVAIRGPWTTLVPPTNTSGVAVALQLLNVPPADTLWALGTSSSNQTLRRTP